MRPLGQIVCACLMPLLLNGCAAGLALTGVSVLSSLVSDGGASRPPHLQIDPNRDLSERLAGIDHDVDPLCSARLEDLRRQHGPVEPPPPGECVIRPACLGGMQKPMEISVCAEEPDPEDGGSGAKVAGSPERSGVAWSWSQAAPAP